MKELTIVFVCQCRFRGAEALMVLDTSPPKCGRCTLPFWSETKGEDGIIVDASEFALNDVRLKFWEKQNARPFPVRIMHTIPGTNLTTAYRQDGTIEYMVATSASPEDIAADYLVDVQFRKARP